MKAWLSFSEPWNDWAIGGDRRRRVRSLEPDREYATRPTARYKQSAIQVRGISQHPRQQK